MSRRTCDEVFDALTRAPFPAGDDTDCLIEDHIGVCHECRQLAEALRPATELFAEALSPREQDSLPAYRGRIVSVMDRIRQEAPPPATASAFYPVHVPDEPLTMRRGVVPAIVVALLLLVAVTRGPGASAVLNEDSLQDAGPHVTHAVGSPERPCLLAGFSLRPECLPRSVVGPPRRVKDTGGTGLSAPRVGADRDRSAAMHQLATCRECHEAGRVTQAMRACCTNCHSAKSPTGLADLRFPRLTASCKACHG